VADNADNYWRGGNLLANLDVDTGVIRRVVRGKGVALEELANHPGTGQKVAGLALPHSRRLVNSTRSAPGCSHRYAITPSTWC